jgi:hypothetical protein
MLDHLQRIGAGFDIVFFGVRKVHGALWCSCETTAGGDRLSES